MLPGVDRIELPASSERLWILTDDGQGLASTIAEQFAKKGEKALILSFPESLVPIEAAASHSYKSVRLKDSSISCLKETLKDIVDSHGNIAGFVHVHPKRKVVGAGHIEDTFLQSDQQLIKEVFFIANILSASLNGGGGHRQTCFITVTRMDGKLGLSKNEPFNIIPGALSGLTKSLAREWKNVFARAIDISPETDNLSAAGIIMNELRDSNFNLAEVGIDANGRRWTPDLENTDAQPKSFGNKTPDQNSVFVVSGGGRGVTADCVKELAEKCKSKFILMGRTSIDDPEPEWARGLRDREELKLGAINFLRKQGGKPTPVKVEKILNSLLSKREIKDTLKRIVEVGGKAVYLSVDITNQIELEAGLKEAESKLGKITAIIHGAGNLADKKIHMKTEDDFSMVFGPKVKGLENLTRTLDPKQIDHFIIFSSVSGYWGNAGQTDYSMANEVLNKFSACFQMLYPNSHVSSINWGPWDSGMMTPILKELYKERGIELIPIQTGAELCYEELAYPDNNHQVVVSGPLAPPLESDPPNTAGYTLSRTLLRKDNPFLEDHVIAGSPVLPATCSVNWMVKSCEDMLSTEYKFVELENFKVLKGIIFDNQEDREYIAELNLTAEKNSDEAKARAQIYSYAKNQQPVFHYSADLKFSKARTVSPVYTEFNLKPDNKISASQDEIYSSSGFLFHGKSFRGVENILNIDDKKITVSCRLPFVDYNVQGQFQANSFNPYITDAQLHPTLIWSLHNLSKKCLPVEFGKLEQFESLDFNRQFYISATVSQSSFYLDLDIASHDERGKIFHKWTGAKFVLKDY